MSSWKSICWKSKKLYLLTQFDDTKSNEISFKMIYWILDLHHDLGIPPLLILLWCIFAHPLILEYPDHHQNLISSSLYYPGPLHKISSQSVHNFLSNVVHRQTDKQTNATKIITSFAKEVISLYAHHNENVHCLHAYQFILFTNITHNIQSAFSTY